VNDRQPSPNAQFSAFLSRFPPEIVAMAIFPGWVRRYFDKSLPDPKGLLEGSGAKVRGVTIKAASDLDHGDIHGLLKAAIKHSGVTFPRARSTRMVIKSDSK
jgi:hypothetical protein